MNILYSFSLIMLAVIIKSSLASQAKGVDTDQAWIQQLNEHLAHDSAPYCDEALQIIDSIRAAPQSCSTGKIISSTQQHNKKTLPTAEANMPTENRYPRLLVFVSSSMPMATLKQLGEQLQHVDGKLVFRGLINNSFKEMAAFLKDLGHEALIDPTLFTRLNIQAVPAFVLFATAPHSIDKLPTYDHLRGNIGLSSALDIFNHLGKVRYEHSKERP